jgi:hypothetical protein
MTVCKGGAQSSRRCRRTARIATRALRCRSTSSMPTSPSRRPSTSPCWLDCACHAEGQATLPGRASRAPISQGCSRLVSRLALSAADQRPACQPRRLVDRLRRKPLVSPALADCACHAEGQATLPGRASRAPISQGCSRLVSDLTNHGHHVAVVVQLVSRLALSAADQRPACQPRRLVDKLHCPDEPHELPLVRVVVDL